MTVRTTNSLLTVILIGGLFSFIACGGGGGGSDAEPATRLAFVTSTLGTGDLSTWDDAGGLTGLAAADAVCQARATAGGLPGTFVAWMSDSTDDAYCRAHGLTGKKADNCGLSELPAFAGPWVKVDGTPFAAQLDVALDDGVIYTPADVDEFGASLPSVRLYWTGSDHNGTQGNLDNTCSSWVDSSASYSGYLGDSSGTTHRWTTGSATSCGSARPLLCLEAGSNNTMPAFGDSGKVVFLSSAVGNGRMGSWTQAGGESGVAAGDAICQSLAADASLPRASSFKAWLSDSTMDAVDHITSDGPWVRIDGIKVAENMSSLVNTGLLTSISVTETGEYRPQNVFTGTIPAGTIGASSCSDWTSKNPVVTGTRGNSAYSLTDWTEWAGPTNCEGQNPIYCFED